MSSAILAALSGFLTVIVSVVKFFMAKNDAKAVKRDKLAEAEAAETDAAMAAVDRELDGVQPPGTRQQ